MNVRLVGMVKVVALALVASPASAQYIPRGQDRDALGQALQGHDFWNDYGQQRRLGATSKAPRWVTAYKFAAEQATTRLQSIEVQIGKNGVLTPVAHLDPVTWTGVQGANAPGDG